LPLTEDDLTWVDVVATAHVYDWKIGEVRSVNVQDSETRLLIDAGLLLIVHEAMRALMPPPARTPPSGAGCGCG